MTTCEKCGAAMKPLFYMHSLFCPNDCDRKPAAQEDDSSRIVDWDGRRWRVTVFPKGSKFPKISDDSRCCWNAFNGNISREQMFELPFGRNSWVYGKKLSQLVGTEQWWTRENGNFEFAMAVPL